MEAVAVRTEVVRIVDSQTKSWFEKLRNIKIKVLAEAKLSSITDLISIALTDDEISEEELNKFRKMKEKIRTKLKKILPKRENSEPN